MLCNCPKCASIDLPFYSDAPDDLCLVVVANGRQSIEQAAQRAGNVMVEVDVDRLELKPIEHDDGDGDGDDLIVIRVIMVQLSMEAMEWLVDCCYSHLLLPMHRNNSLLHLLAHHSEQDL